MSDNFSAEPLKSHRDHSSNKFSQGMSKKLFLTTDSRALLDSIRKIVKEVKRDNPKFDQRREKGFNMHEQIKVTAKAVKAQQGHLATYSTPMEMALREREEKQIHEAMLRKELIKFRGEVEAKFRKSETNRKYVFPKVDEDVEEEGSEFLLIPVNCNLFTL